MGQSSDLAYSQRNKRSTYGEDFNDAQKSLLSNPRMSERHETRTKLDVDQRKQNRMTLNSKSSKKLPSEFKSKQEKNNSERDKSMVMIELSDDESYHE